LSSGTVGLLLLLRNGRSGSERFRIEEGLKTFVEVASTRSVRVPRFLDSKIVTDSTKEFSETGFVEIRLLRVSSNLLLLLTSVPLRLLLILLSVLRLLMEVSLLKMRRVVGLRRSVLLELLLRVATDRGREGFLIERRGTDSTELTG